MEVENKRLIEMARFIARFAGSYDSKDDTISRCSCVIKDSTKTLTFKTSKMSIIVGTDTLELCITKIENDNPVVVSDRTGDVYRFHGELAHLEEEIKDVFAKCGLISLGM